MKKITQLSKAEKLILIKSLAAGEVDLTKLSNETLFNFDKRKARDGKNIINLGESSKITFVYLTLDETNELLPFKCIESGVSYSFEKTRIVAIDDNINFIFTSEATANKYLECIELWCGGKDKSKFATMESLKFKNRFN